MATLQYTIDINVPKQHVWDVMLADPTYREWTDAFHEGSYYEGSWDKGSPIQFLAEDDGKLSGMSARIVENIPYEYISIEQLGEIIDGQEAFDTEDSKQWAGSHENYTFSETGGLTTVLVELTGDNMSSEIVEMFDEMWPVALDKLKEVAER